MTALAVDHDGGVWIATAEGPPPPLQIWRHGRFNTIATLANPISCRIRSRVATSSITIDAGVGPGWVTDSGLTRYERGAAASSTVKDGLVNDNIRVIADSARGRPVDRRLRRTRSYLDTARFTNCDQRDGLPGNMIRALYEDADGVLWDRDLQETTASRRFHDGKFTHFTTRDGLFRRRRLPASRTAAATSG